MLSLLFTRQFLLERKSMKTNHPANSLIYTDSSKSVYTVRRVETTHPPTGRSHLKFEIECLAATSEQKIFIGLMETDGLGTSSNSPGLGISIDMDSGLVMDLVNQQGVIGFLESAPLPTHEPLRITVDVEIIQHVYLPRITVGTESILHPALYLEVPGQLSALVGASVVPHGATSFENAKLELLEAQPVGV